MYVHSLQSNREHTCTNYALYTNLCLSCSQFGCQSSLTGFGDSQSLFHHCQTSLELGEAHTQECIYTITVHTQTHYLHTYTHTQQTKRNQSEVCSTSLHCTIQSSTTFDSLKHSSETEKLRMCAHTNVRTHACIIGIHMYVCTHLCKDMQVSPTKSECNSSLLHTRFVQLTIHLSNAHNCPMYVCMYIH